MKEIILNLSLFIFSFIVIDFVYYKFVNKFPIKKYMHFLSIIIPSVIICYTRFFTFEFFLFCAILEILTILSFTDILHFEIDKKSYWLLLVLCFTKILFTTPEEVIMDAALSPIIMYFVFWLFDKLFGIENLGGADVKIMLILSFYYPATDIFSFVIWTFGICLILFIIYSIKKRSLRKVQVPMIVGIALSFFIQEAFLIG